MHKRLPLFILFIAFAFASLHGSPPGALAQQSSPAPPKQLKPSRYSAALPRGEFQDNQIELVPDQERRRLRESRYKGEYPEIKDPGLKPTGPINETTYVIKDYADQIDPLPVSRSAAVVVGTVLSGKAFVSKDRTYVYSDFQVDVDQVLKQDAQVNLVAGGRMVVSRGGGSIHFPSGRVKDYINHGEGMPAIGSQYLFFLVRPDISEPEYEVIIGGAYELKDGKVHPLDDFNIALDNSSELELLSKVRSLLAGVTP